MPRSSRLLGSPGRRLSPATMPAEDHGPEADSRILARRHPASWIRWQQELHEDGRQRLHPDVVALVPGKPDGVRSASRR
jgi:hypothetical protein